MGLTLVDSSVWIDLLNDAATPHVAAIHRLLDDGQPLAIGDLVLVEVLQGARRERQFAEALRFFASFVPVAIAGRDVAVHAARLYRDLRGRGITVRKTIDTLIATRCILDDIPLLYSDRDFDPFVQHLGLRSALTIGTA